MATPCQGTFLAGVPATARPPSASSISAADASSMLAATRLALSITRSADITSAGPPVMALRLPKVPVPIGVPAVSPCSTLT